jgi:hypothetical protein
MNMPRWNNPNCGFQKGHKNYLTKESIKKMSKTRIGKRLSEKTKEKLSKRLKADYLTGKKIPFWKNKKQTIESNQKRRESLMGKKFSPIQRKNISISAKNRGVPFGTKSPNWQGGKSFEPYSPSFNQQLKDRIRVRDNFICQLCRVPELECNRRLTVHHIDYNKQNCEENNLISLCNCCNLKVNSKRKHWEQFFKSKMEVLSQL